MKPIKKIIFSAMLLVFALAAYAATAPVLQLLPNSNAVKGFGVLSGSLQYGKGDDLTKIYDGGYELYTKGGVIDAARQMYQKKKEYVEVTIHTMKSEKVAIDFLKYWQKENKIKSLTKSAASNGFLVSKPNTSAYFVKQKYFYTVSTFRSDTAAKQSVNAFVTAIAKRIK